MTDAKRALETIHAACMLWIAGRADSAHALTQVLGCLEDYGMPVILPENTANDYDMESCG